MFSGEHKQFQPPEFECTLCMVSGIKVIFFIPLNNSCKRGSLVNDNKSKAKCQINSKNTKITAAAVWVAAAVWLGGWSGSSGAFRRIKPGLVQSLLAGLMRQKATPRFWQNQSSAHNHRRQRRKTQGRSSILCVYRLECFLPRLIYFISLKNEDIFERSSKMETFIRW